MAWSLGDVAPARTTYALEGSVFVTGAALQWLRDGLGLIQSAAEAGPLAESVPDAGGAVFVPAFTGLGSPWWDPEARGAVVGLSRGVGRAHLVRAAVEAMAYQSADVVGAMIAATGIEPSELRVDGGASAMDLLLDIQAALLGLPVKRAATTDTTAVGAAFLAGLATGVWSSTDQIAQSWAADAEVAPDPDTAATARAGHKSWRRAVESSRAFN